LPDRAAARETSGSFPVSLCATLCRDWLALVAREGQKRATSNLRKQHAGYWSADRPPNAGRTIPAPPLPTGRETVGSTLERLPKDQSLSVAAHSEGRLRQPAVYPFESLSPDSSSVTCPLSNATVKPYDLALVGNGLPNGCAACTHGIERTAGATPTCAPSGQSFHCPNSPISRHPTPPRPCGRARIVPNRRRACAACGRTLHAARSS